MTKRALLFIVIFAALPLRADFNAVVREVESHSGLHRVRIPFLGLARFLVWVARPDGVHDFQLATFEGDARDIDGRLIGNLLLRNAGPGFRQLVRVVSNRHGGEWTYVYARPNGNVFEMVIATHDHSDTTVVRAVVDVDRLQRAVNSGRHGMVMVSLK